MKPIKATVIVLFLVLIFLISSICYDYSQPKITGKSTSTFKGDFTARVDPGIQVYDFTFNGNTTNFLQMNNTALENITNMTLEIDDVGKIIFNIPTNLTKCAKNNIVDLDSYITISPNFIEIDTANLSCLNTSAELSLYNLSFANPRILKDGQICPAIICTQINYIGGTLIFNVTGFSNYSTEETPGSGTNVNNPRPGRKKDPYQINPPQIVPPALVVPNIEPTLPPTVPQKKDMFDIVRKQAKERPRLTVRAVPVAIVYIVSLSALAIIVFLVLIKGTINHRRKKK